MRLTEEQYREIQERCDKARAKCKFAPKLTPAPKPTPKPHKYSAKPTVVDGIRFASKAESDRYGHLKLLEKNQFIYGLELQPKFPIHVNGQKICTYMADFRYRKTVGGDDIIEDVKGIKTPVYRLKKKLFEACYPHLKLTEIT